MHHTPVKEAMEQEEDGQEGEDQNAVQSNLEGSQQEKDIDQEEQDLAEDQQRQETEEEEPDNN
ncbi:MAG: hypothetical protein ACMG6E_02810 [Candidatus Roizmanbacteria bacterium]